MHRTSSFSLNTKIYVIGPSENIYAETTNSLFIYSCVACKKLSPGEYLRWRKRHAAHARGMGDLCQCSTICFFVFLIFSAPPNTAKLMFFRVTWYLQIDVGSMDEHSTKSVEEYEGLAMRDVMTTGQTMCSKLWVKDELTCPGEQHS
jgi:hypothetical protein